MSEMNDVVQPVLDEVKKLGAMSKENIDELRSNFEKLKSDADRNGEKVDGLLKLKLDRLAADIATRQDEIDKAFAEQKAAEEALSKRQDELDVLMQRHAVTDGGGDNKAEEELKSFVLSVSHDAQGKAHVVNGKIEELRASFPEYKKAFDKYLRVNGNHSNLSVEDQKALSVGSEPDGGFSVTPTMSSRIIERLYESSPLRSLASVQSITSDSLEMMVDRFDTTTVGWESETIAGAETNTPKMAKLRIPVHVLFARPTATQQLLEDAGINVENWLAVKAADQMARTEATSFVTGTGSGQPQGFLTYASGTAWGQIQQVAMGLAAALTADGFVRVKYALKEQYLNRGTWLMNRDAVMNAMLLKDGNGDYIWKPSMLANDPTATILGAPVRMAADMPIVAAGALAVAYADWRETYQIVDRLGITVIRDPYTKKPYVEFYFRKRVGGDVVNFEAIKLGIVSV